MKSANNIQQLKQTGKAIPALIPVCVFKPHRPFPPIQVIRPLKPRTELIMTKAIRRQLYTVDLVHGIIAATQCADVTLPKKTKAVIARILSRVRKIKKVVWGGDTYNLSPRDEKKHGRVVKAMQKLLHDAIMGDWFETDLITAVLFLVEEARESSKRSSNFELKMDWLMLNQSLYTLYNHLTEEDQEPEPRDNDWPGYKYESLGAMLGKQFEKEIMQ